MVKFLTNRVISVAIVVLGAFAASAELVKTPILDAENVSVGYKVTGLENGEVAMVYTNHLRTATLRVRANLENVQFLVVGGGGGGGVGFMGAGGGGGGVVTGYVYKLEKGVKISVKIGAGGTGGTNKNPSGVGGDSSIIVGETSYVLAYGGGAGGNSVNGGDGGSGAGGGKSSSTQNPVKYIGGEVKEAECAEGVLFAESFGHKGGSNGTSAYSSGGGGGAMGAGGDSDVAKGGVGGVGLKMDITGALITYGSGGGGAGNAQKGTGGENAGTGGKGGVNGTSAKANCGGGGGGGGPASTAGGDGGSGIVVLRYKEPNTSGFKIIVR